MPAQGNSSQDPISKITTKKWTRGMAQVVESLLCKGKAMSSNPTLTNNKTKNEKQNGGLCYMQMILENRYNKDDRERQGVAIC
jgi:hypothetical protein